MTGADNVVAWRTGYQFGVNHARGYPRFNPGEYTTSDTLARRGRRGHDDRLRPDGQLFRACAEDLASIPYIVPDTKETPTTRAAVAFTVATYGINTGGTVYRMDDVPISLRSAFPSPHPGDFEVLTAIERASRSCSECERNAWRRHCGPTSPRSRQGIASTTPPMAWTASCAIWIADGRTAVAAPSDPAVRPSREIDARGMVDAGGIDMHCHIAGPAVNVARKLRPEDKRRGELLHRTSLTHSGTMGCAQHVCHGYKHAGMGYTTAFDAAILPLGYRHAHEEFEDTPCIDKGFYVLMGNNHYVMKVVAGARAGEAGKRSSAGCSRPPRASLPKLVTLRPRSGRIRRATLAASIPSSTISTSLRGRYRRRRRQGGRRAAAAASRPHPLQQPGDAGQLDHYPRDDEGPRRPPRTHHPRSFIAYGGGEGDENTFNSKVAPRRLCQLP
ncbi:MAG: amidohydrolase family protein [Pirellulales bacterium]